VETVRNSKRLHRFVHHAAQVVETLMMENAATNAAVASGGTAAPASILGLDDTDVASFTPERKAASMASQGKLQSISGAATAGILCYYSPIITYC
jgi:hypothetical protein